MLFDPERPSGLGVLWYLSTWSSGPWVARGIPGSLVPVAVAMSEHATHCDRKVNTVE